MPHSFPSHFPNAVRVSITPRVSAMIKVNTRISNRLLHTLMAPRVKPALTRTRNYSRNTASQHGYERHLRRQPRPARPNGSGNSRGGSVKKAVALSSGRLPLAAAAADGEAEAELHVRLRLHIKRLPRYRVRPFQTRHHPLRRYRISSMASETRTQRKEEKFLKGPGPKCPLEIARLPAPAAVTWQNNLGCVWTRGWAISNKLQVSVGLQILHASRLQS